MWTNIRSQFGDFTNSTNFVVDKKQNQKNWIKMPFVATHFIHFENCIRLTGRVIDPDMKKTRDFGLIIIWFFIGKYMKGKKQSIFLFVSLQFGFNFQEYSFWCNWLAHDSAQQWYYISYFSKYNTSFIFKIRI